MDAVRSASPNALDTRHPAPSNSFTPANTHVLLRAEWLQGRAKISPPIGNTFRTEGAPDRQVSLNEQEEWDSPATAISPVLQGRCTALAVLRKPDGLWLHDGGRKPIPGETTALSGYTRPIAAHATQMAKPHPEIELFL